MMAFRTRVETTYADLRPDDLIIDKSGQAWPIALVEYVSLTDLSSFWLLDPVTKVKQHLISKSGNDAVTVSRRPKQADEAAKLEADFPKFSAPVTATSTTGAPATTTTKKTTTTTQDGLLTTPAGAGESSLEEAVANVEAVGGTIEVEVTADEVDAAAASTEEQPVASPPFADMTPLEMRSHLYLIHGCYANDVKSRDDIIAMHAQAHADHDSGKLQSCHVPHTHDGEFPK